METPYDKYKIFTTNGINSAQAYLNGKHTRESLTAEGWKRFDYFSSYQNGPENPGHIYTQPGKTVSARHQAERILTYWNAQGDKTGWRYRPADPAEQPYSLIFSDQTGNRENWRTIYTFSADPCHLPTDPETSQADEEEILRQLFAAGLIQIAPEGSGTPGYAYAHPPTVRVYSSHIVVMQTGGIDI